VEAAAHNKSPSHELHHIQISQIPANRLLPVRTSSDFRKKPFSHLSPLNTIWYYIDPTSPHNDGIIQMPRILLDHHRAARGHRDGR
jgi:hypothetical protein